MKDAIQNVYQYREQLESRIIDFEIKLNKFKIQNEYLMFCMIQPPKTNRVQKIMYLLKKYFTEIDHNTLCFPWGDVWLDNWYNPLKHYPPLCCIL